MTDFHDVILDTNGRPVDPALGLETLGEIAEPSGTAGVLLVGIGGVDYQIPEDYDELGAEALLARLKELNPLAEPSILDALVWLNDGDLRASGGRMADTAPTLTPMVVSIEGVDYQLPQPITEAGLRMLNPTITDDHLAVLVNLTAAAPEDTLVEAPAPATAIGEWTADPLVPFGVATRDGRMIRAGALSWSDQLPVPLMAMLEDVHGPSMTLPSSLLAGAITSLSADETRLVGSGTFDDSDAGRAAMQAVTDGRMGISVDLAVTEYEFVMSQESVDEMQQEMDGEAPAEDVPAEDAPSEDVPGGVVVEQGTLEDEGMFVVTAGEVMGATIVPFAAFDSARIELTSLAADGHPTHATVVMPLRAAPVVEPTAPPGPSPSLREGVTGPPTPRRSDGSVTAIAATLETLAASLRATAEPARSSLDAETITALAALVAAAQPDQSALVAAIQVALSQPREPAAPQTTIINPPAVTYTAPEVHVDNHQPDVHVTNPAAKPGSLRVVRDKQGNAIRYETEAS